MDKWRQEYMQIKGVVPYVFCKLVFDKFKSHDQKGEVTKENLRQLKLSDQDAQILASLYNTEGSQMMEDDNESRLFKSQNTLRYYETYKQKLASYKAVLEQHHNPPATPKEFLSKLITDHLNRIRVGQIRKVPVTIKDDPLGEIKSGIDQLVFPLFSGPDVPEWSATSYQISLKNTVKNQIQLNLELIQPYGCFGWSASSSVLVVWKTKEETKEFVAYAASSTNEEAVCLQCPLIFDSQAQYSVFVVVGHKQILLPCYLKVTGTTDLTKIQKKKVEINPTISLRQKINMFDRIFSKISEQYSEQSNLKPGQSESRIQFKIREQIQKRCLIQMTISTETKLNADQREAIAKKHYLLTSPLYSIDSTEKVYRFMFLGLHASTEQFSFG